jgi:hypothetical protein
MASVSAGTPSAGKAVVAVLYHLCSIHAAVSADERCAETKPNGNAQFPTPKA